MTEPPKGLRTAGAKLWREVHEGVALGGSSTSTT